WRSSGRGPGGAVSATASRLPSGGHATAAVQSAGVVELPAATAATSTTSPKPSGSNSSGSSGCARSLIGCLQHHPQETSQVGLRKKGG
ncbi:unnamed protein product, partial [Ectocarpus fasciculatus]